MIQEEYVDYPAQGLRVEDIVVPIENGSALKGSFYSCSTTPQATVILNGATAVPAGFYDSFARWMAENRNVNVITYDYRDFGKSATGHVKHSKATMADWGVKDQGAVLRYVLETVPGTPVWIIGHSLGGLCLLFQEEARHVDRLITIASGPASISAHPITFLPAVFAFWWLIGPVATGSLGYLPGKAIGLGADVPAGVYWQWRKWCTTKGFHRSFWGKSVPQPDLNRFQGRLDIFGIEDDQMISAPQTSKIREFYPAAETTFTVLKPRDYDLKSIGHLGAFASKNKALWPTLLPE